MKTKRLPLLTALAAALLTAGLAEAKSDAWITAKVKSKLAAAEDVRAFGTNVDTKDGVVTLRGEVETQAERMLAERHAESIGGVRRVDNRLIVREDAERGLGDKALAGIDDAAITARVKAALAGNRATKARRINVDTKEGEVLLRGSASSDSEKTLAEEIARGVNGVRSVDNRIEVR